MSGIDLVAVLLFAVLSGLAALHFYWAMGGLWPGIDEKSLARRVVGSPAVRRMPSRPVTVVVAGLLALAALWPLMWTALIPYPLPQALVWLGMIGLAIVFLGRGIAGYTPVFRAHFPEEPFASLDRRYYSPLCLAIGALFVLLILLARL
ncbi:MAG: DUF3995 domain-containing protein [Pseudomonadota bacterium]|nr:DUF3995 domain-containing protein [Pseudomonadota bacterium]